MYFYTIMNIGMYALLSVIAYFLFANKASRQSFKISNNKNFFTFSLLWFILFMGVLWYSEASHIGIINEFTHWLSLVLLPVIGLKIINQNKIKEILQSLGFTKNNLKGCIKSSILICLIMTPFYIIILGLYYQVPITVLIENPINILINSILNISLYFIANILTAGFTEEVFFRGILQNSLSEKMKSFLMPIIISSLLFGLYHFPYAYFQWEETQGNIIGSLVSVLTEQAVTGIFFAVIYSRCKNIFVLIIVHSYSNALVLLFSNFLVKIL